MQTQEDIQSRYDHLSEEFFDIYYSYHPPHATRQGLHQYDHHLGHYRQDEIQDTLKRMKAVQSELRSIDPSHLDALHALDHPVLTTRLKREIYWIEEWRFWENNPLFYKDILTEGIFNLVSRDFAPLAERLQAVIDRERCVPEVLQAARQNLKNPPSVYTEQAVRYMQGAQLFFQGLPEAFVAVEDLKLQKEFMAANQQVLVELEKFLNFLNNDLLPRSHGNFAVGESAVQKIIAAEEMIDAPVQQILERCYNDLERIDAQISELVKQINPLASEAELRQQMRSQHPSHEQLLPTMRASLHSMRSALIEHNLLTIPDEMPDVIVSPMPTYAGAGGMMLTPGPFETVAQEAFLAINLPKPDWSPERIENQLQDFNQYSVDLLFMHEAYPGHHLQFYLEKRVPLRASKDHDSDSNSDGWAEYGKYMLVDEVYGPLDPFYHLSALQSKRGSIVASIVGLEIHLEQKNLQQATEWLVNKGGRSPENAARLLDRAIYYPSHLTYYIGGEMLRKLRQDYQKLRGSAFSLKDFHDRFLTYGLIPIQVIRQDMLGAADDGILFKEILIDDQLTDRIPF